MNVEPLLIMLWSNRPWNMARIIWQHNSWMKETTLRKTNSSAVTDIDWEGKGKNKKNITTWGIPIWLPIQLQTPPNRTYLYWSGETRCRLWGIVIPRCFCNAVALWNTILTYLLYVPSERQLLCSVIYCNSDCLSQLDDRIAKIGRLDLISKTV